MEQEDLCLEVILNDRAQMADLLNGECIPAGDGGICKTAARCTSSIFLSRLAPLAHELDLEGSTLCLMQQRFLAGSCLHQLPLNNIKQELVCFGFAGVRACSAQAHFQAFKAPAFSALPGPGTRGEALCHVHPGPDAFCCE